MTLLERRSRARAGGPRPDKRLSVAIHHKRIEPYLDGLQARQRLKALLQKSQGAKYHSQTMGIYDNSTASVCSERRHKHDSTNKVRVLTPSRLRPVSGERPETASYERQNTVPYGPANKPLTIASLLVSPTPLPQPPPSPPCSPPRCYDAVPSDTSAGSLTSSDRESSPNSTSSRGTRISAAERRRGSFDVLNTATIGHAPTMSCQAFPTIALTELEKKVTILGQPLEFGTLDCARFAGIL